MLPVDPLALRDEVRAKYRAVAIDIRIGPPVDTFGRAGGESKARLFAVFGYAFLAQKPG